MKANEAPEKLYLIPNGFISYCRNNNEDIEYTCTDAFIEKAEEFLYKKLNNGDMECGDIIAFINDFRNYMKGE